MTHDPVVIIDQAAEAVQVAVGSGAHVGVILGSGLGPFADHLSSAKSIAFEAIPGFPTSSVAGHPGRLVRGMLGETRVVALAGRVHGYEGYSADEVAFPVRVLARLGIRALVVTNSSGCINAKWSPGDLMRITDHINLSGRNPLVGPNDARLGPRFPDLSRAYNPRLASELDAAAKSCGLTLRAGVYAQMLGPSYETPAEIRMLRLLGADAVGMSTVPEVIAAAHAGIPVAGVACLTNMAAGILDKPLSHEEVTTTAGLMRDRFVALLEAFVPRCLAALGA